jgi:TolB-like protein/Tfp pilus assembly protein PilF
MDVGITISLKWLVVAAVVLVPVVILILFWLVPGDEDARTIAVLPFKNTNETMEQDYFAEGLAEDLLTDLSKIGPLTVLSRASTFGYEASAVDLGQIASDLGATHVVDGSVRRDGNRIRISVELVEVRTGANVWAERYDREVGELFELQDDVRSKIVSALAIRLAPEDARRLQSGGTAAFTAYDLLLRGRYEESALTDTGVKRAIAYYEQAVNIDPAYADAYARMANMYDFAVRFGWSDNIERDRLRALRLAKKAVTLGSGNPFAYWTYGRVVSRLGGEGEKSQNEAIDALKRAIELEPNYADAYAFISLLYIGSGRPDDANSAMDEAVRLNPRFPFWYRLNRAVIRYMQEDFDAAISDLELAVAQNPTAVFLRWWLAAAYAQVGRQDDAEWQTEEMNALGFYSTVGEIVRSNPVIAFPPYVALFADGLRKAGIPE